MGRWMKEVASFFVLFVQSINFTKVVYPLILLRLYPLRWSATAVLSRLSYKNDALKPLRVRGFELSDSSRVQQTGAGNSLRCGVLTARCLHV